MQSAFVRGVRGAGASVRAEESIESRSRDIKSPTNIRRLEIDMPKPPSESLAK
jgi:hypothetical protein